ncbi:MAG: glutathione S-transferase family protein [Bermanella sp.]
MGLLVDGKWVDQWYDTSASGGEFIRQDAQFRNTIGEGSEFPVESNRYHLYVSLACPWAHRTLIFRKIKKLEQHIGVTVVKAEMLSHGWELSDEAIATFSPSPISDIQYMHQVYTHMNANYNGRVTVPVLWDKKTKRIVNNESSEIIRILNSAFNELTDVKTDYYPQALRSQIDEINELVYHAINNGVYKVGFATQQDVYEKHFKVLFNALDTIEARLENQRYLVGNTITEADWRLFTTLIRFDSVYFGHFKTNLKQIENYPNLSNYLRDLYQQPGVSETVNFEHIKVHYYYSHDTINPTRVVPVGPEINYLSAHNRDRF